MSPDEILALLGVNAVLLPIRKGTKAPTRPGWQTITFSDTLKGTYRAALAKAPAVGVSLGIASEGLCSLDCDDEDFLEEMLALNPQLRPTLRTTAKRGGNLWFVLTDHPPKSRKLKRVGNPVGEFRSTGSQTVIAGLHPEGMRYRPIVKAAPIRLAYGDIIWPTGFADGALSNSSQSPPSSLESPPSSSLHTLHNISARLKASEQARKTLEENPGLCRLYRRFIEKRPLPRQGNRNTDLVTMITFLFRAVGRKQALALAKTFHSVNQDIFIDPLEQHMHEAEEHLSACELTWKCELSDYERELADQLPRAHCEAFRICRDLAALDSAESARGKLFLSMGDLADRLSLRAPEAQRILRVLEAVGCIEIETKGTRHSKGARGIATRYIWKLALFGATDPRQTHP